MSSHLQDDSTLDPSVATAWAFFEHLNRQDLDGAFALLADDATFWTNAFRKAMAKDATRRMLSKVLEGVPIRFELMRAISSGDVVVMEVRGTGETRDQRRYDMVYAFWIELRDVAVVEMREYADTHHGFNTLGPGGSTE